MRCLLIPALWGDFNAGLERTLSMLADGLADRGHTVDVATRVAMDLEHIRQTFGARLDRVTLRSVRSPQLALKRVPVLGPRLMGLAHRRQFKRLTADYDFVLVQSGVIPARSGARRSVLFCEFPRDPVPSSADWRRRLASYDLVVGNSSFTSGWIERYWQRPADVFYPSIQECRPLPKEPIILGVGRFSRGGREKGQREMVDSFRRLVEGGLRGWRLQLAGMRGNDDYLAEVRERAQDLPVEIVLDTSAEELAELYGRASLFWHTTGLGVDQNAEPQRLEHFGIVVGEAMSAGCVPLVFDAAGPREITSVIGPDADQLRWRTLQELQNQTLTFTESPDRCAQFSQRCAAAASEHFGTKAFDRSIDRLLGNDA